ncbi:hypothetical protein [Halomonas sp. H5]|uniref:hypothetical protein n=1 Tax=Halomonas sp. H5 TaxID=3423910 RepID=UPI003D35A40E
MSEILIRELGERREAALARHRYHHQQFVAALNSLRELGGRCPGVNCPEICTAGAALANTTPLEIEATVMAFTDALRDYAYTPEGKAEGEGVLRLFNRSLGEMRALAHHVHHQVEAQREAKLMDHLLRQSRSSEGPGG